MISDDMTLLQFLKKEELDPTVGTRDQRKTKRTILLLVLGGKNQPTSVEKYFAFTIFLIQISCRYG